MSKTADFPIITIITIVYNDVDGIETTIRSVITQATYEYIEYIVIDGGSTDGTVEVIKRYKNKITYWVSESDGGISDAFNKGLAYAHGKFVLMLNSGDTFLHNYAIDINLLRSNTYRIVAYQAKTPYGNVFPKRIVGAAKRNNPVSRIFGKIHQAMLAHQATFVPLAVYKKEGYYDVSYKLRMDFELFLRLLKKYDVLFVEIPIVCYRTDGISSKLRNRLRFKMEEYKAIQKHFPERCRCFDIVYFVILPIYLMKQILSFLKYRMIDLLYGKTNKNRC